jgi:SRSO17 transposase
MDVAGSVRQRHTQVHPTPHFTLRTGAGRSTEDIPQVGRREHTTDGVDTYGTEMDWWAWAATAPTRPKSVVIETRPGIIRGVEWKWRVE